MRDWLGQEEEVDMMPWDRDLAMNVASAFVSSRCLANQRKQ